MLYTHKQLISENLIIPFIEGMKSTKTVTKFKIIQ